MKMISREQFTTVIIICAVGLSSTGCYSYAAVKPTELPKLNGSYAKTVGSTYNPNGTTTPIVEQSVVHLERADGRMMEISGPTDARVTRVNGDATVIEHPVVSRATPNSLFVKGGNIAEQEFALQDIKSVEVEEFQKGPTVALALLPTVITLAIVTVVLTSE